MRADVKGGIIEYFLLEQLLLLIFIHLSFEEVERSAGLFDFYWLALPLLFLEDGAQITIFPVIFAALHVCLNIFDLICIIV